MTVKDSRDLLIDFSTLNDISTLIFHSFFTGIIDIIFFALCFLFCLIQSMSFPFILFNVELNEQSSIVIFIGFIVLFSRTNEKLIWNPKSKRRERKIRGLNFPLFCLFVYISSPSLSFSFYFYTSLPFSLTLSSFLYRFSTLTPCACFGQLRRHKSSTQLAPFCRSSLVLALQAEHTRETSRVCHGLKFIPVQGVSWF